MRRELTQQYDLKAHNGQRLVKRTLTSIEELGFY
jgi:hypothetical protein